jgi:TDG/mug DNA glycosylase family protein
MAKRLKGPADPVRQRAFERLRLRDRIEPGVRVLFVGINPGVRSAETGHHFAGYSNRFWKLLYESRLVPEPITYVDDDRLAEFGYGITNIVPRPSPGMTDLRPQEYQDGARVLMDKIRAFQPEIVALVGVTVYRALLISLGDRAAVKRPVALGFQTPPVPFPAKVFVLPNPSGRNANYSHAEMLQAFKALTRALR